MLGWFDEPRIREMLHIPADRRIGLVITLGYAAEGQIRPKQRKSASLMCSRNSY
jgi:nitroreductase